MRKMKNLLALAAFGLPLICLLPACQSGGAETGQSAEAEQPAEPIHERGEDIKGGIMALDPGMSDVVDPDAVIEVLAGGFTWTEGPLWLEDQQMLIFADIPPNKIYSWKEGQGVRVYLSPAGYTGDTPRGGEPGSNGMILDNEGRLVLCQHGDRRMARMDAPLSAPKPNFVTIADQYQGKKLNSPNDCIMNSKGQLFFTDPPYGLEKNMDDPAKELTFQGVYRVDPNGSLILLTDQLSRPNGVALSPDEKTLYVANSDPEHAIWMAYGLDSNGAIASGTVFHDVTGMVGVGKGLPDGMKVRRDGVLFATGPGGVWVFNAAGKNLGRINTGQATANCALTPDGKMLYLCADDFLMRVALK